MLLYPPISAQPETEFMTQSLAAMIFADVFMATATALVEEGTFACVPLGCRSALPMRWSTRTNPQPVRPR